MAFLNLGLRVIAFRDAVVTSNPQRKGVDENLSLNGILTETPSEYPLDLAAGERRTLFDGTRAITLDGTTQIALSLSPLSPDRYRLAWTGTGTAPGFRTERAVGASGHSLTLTLNANLSVTVTGTGPTYTAAQVGDDVLIPGVATGDPAGPFSPANAGRWSVIGVTSTSVTLARPADETTTGASEVVAVTAADQFLVYSPGSVKVGDQVNISGGFSVNAQRTYVVQAVSSRWLDVQSGDPLAAETALPGASGLTVYASAVRILLIELDQLASVYLNGDTDETLPLEPVTDQAGQRVGFLVMTGPVWACDVRNRAATSAEGLAVAFR